MRRVPDPSTLRPFDPSTPPPRRRGFTLVELLMVILILSALIALLLPAIASIRQNVHISQVRTEIGGLEQAIAAFRTTYGVDPPSSLIICQNPADWNANARRRESKAFIRRLWPSFNFDHNDGATPPNYMPGGMPLEVFADNGPVFTLYGDECLVFFLGGMMDTGGALSGFSTNPALPFSPPVPLSSQTRKGPFFDFATDRIVPSDNVVGAHVYVDPMAAKVSSTNGYVYLSSRDGRGYNIDTDPNSPTFGQCLDCPPNSGLQFVYSTSGGAPYKPKSFQIIAAGADGEYGTGGPWAPDGQIRQGEEDNITNFHDGTLGG